MMLLCLSLGQNKHHHAKTLARRIKVLIRKKRKKGLCYGPRPTFSSRMGYKWNTKETVLKTGFHSIRYLNIIYVACREERLELNEIESNRIIQTVSHGWFGIILFKALGTIVIRMGFLSVVFLIHFCKKNFYLRFEFPTKE